MWFRRALLIGFFLLWLNNNAMAQTAPGVTLQVAAYFGGSFKPGQWLPLRVTASNDGPDLRATLRIGGTTGATYDTPVELPRGARKGVVVYARPESFAHTLRVRLLDGERELTSADVKVSSWTMPTDVVGELTERPITAPQPAPRSRQLRVATLPLTLDDLPARPEALSSFDALIVDGNTLDGLQPD